MSVDTTTGEILEAATPKLAAALSRLQATLPIITKSRTATVTGKDGGRGYTYTYAGLPDIVEVIYPLLAAQGLSFTCRPVRGPLGYELVGVLMHESGEQISGVFPIFGQTAQAIGSSLSYGKRYLLCCLSGVTTADDDDDGAAAQGAKGRTQGQGRREAYETGPQRAERVKGTPADDPWYTDPPVVPDGPAPVSGGAPADPSTSSPSGQTPRVEPTVDARTSGGAKKSQVQALTIKFRALGVEDRDERLRQVRKIVDREDVSSANELTESEVLRVLDVLEADLLAKQDRP